MTDSGAPYAPPPPSSGPAPFVPPPSGRRTSMVLRHLMSAVVALVLTPVGVLVFDHGAGSYRQELARTLDSSEGGSELLQMVAGALILLAVVACARLSGLGPVLAGLVWGLLPFVWYLVDVPSFFDFTRDLPSTYFWFSLPEYLFPLVAVMLVGAGLVGRWRGRPQ